MTDLEPAPAVVRVPHPARATPQAWLEVDLDAVRHNVEVLSRRAGGAELMVVVKADGYSLGATRVARAALEAGATWLGVATLDEALELRSSGVAAPLLAWLAAPGADYGRALARRVDLAASSAAQLDEIASAARRAGRTARLHLEVETGMWRGGAADEWPALVARARELEVEGRVQVVGVWSHLARADEPGHPATDDQQAAFHRAVAVARSAGLRPRLLHMANSAATLTRPDLHLDMVRCGLATYGVDPLAAGPSGAGLRTAVTFRARVVLVKDAPAGAGVSYGHTYTTARATRLALVPVGYADGVPMVPPGGHPVGYRGTSVRVAGRVCMDQLVLDVGDLPVAAGDQVTLLGPGDDGEHTPEQWARLSGRSAYEVLTGLARKRVRVTYRDSASDGSRRP